MKPVKLFAGVAMALALLSGCSDDDAPAAAAGGGATVTGGVVKGPVSGSTVCAYAVTGGTKGAKLTLALPAGAAGSISGGCYVTPANGAYNFALPAGTTGDVLVEATGGTFCSNEATIIAGACSGGGTVLNLGGAVLSSVVNVSGGSTAVYTTPLTTAAVNASAGSLSAVNFNAQFNTLAGRVIGPNSGVTPATPPTAANQPYLAQVSTYIQGGGTLTTAVSSLQQGTTTFPPGSGGGSAGATTPATVGEGIAAVYNLKFYRLESTPCPTAGCPYSEGQSVPVTVYADGRLSLPGKELTNPFNRNFGSGPHLPEIIWLDSTTQLEYALSDNTGVFNEINIGDASTMGQFGPQSFGQLRLPAPDGAAALTALAGVYPKAYQYNGTTVPWNTVTIAADGGISFTGGAGPDLSAANRTGINAFLNQVAVTGTVGTGTLTITIIKDSAGAVRSIKYDLAKDSDGSNDTGVRLGSVAARAPHDGTMPSTTQSRISGTVGTTVLDFAMSTSQGSANNLFLAFEGNGGSGASPLLSVNMSPTGSIVPGTYDCNRTPASTIFVSARKLQNGTLINTINGGRCTIVITEYTHSGSTVTSLKGTFTAEMYDSDQATSPALGTVLNGVFSIIAAP